MKLNLKIRATCSIKQNFVNKRKTKSESKGKINVSVRTYLIEVAKQNTKPKRNLRNIKTIYEINLNSHYKAR